MQEQKDKKSQELPTGAEISTESVKLEQMIFCLKGF